MPNSDHAPAAEELDLTGISYEQARDELMSVVRQLESGTATLAQSIELWQRGEQLASRCQRLLESARSTVAAVVEDPGRVLEDSESED
jgi:exodeoxyribonuclease VII small subunit